MCARDMDAMRYTSYTDECCRTITEAAEYPSDGYLVHLVRLHRVGDRISRVLSADDFDPVPALSAPIGMCVRSLESELQQLKDSQFPVLPGPTSCKQLHPLRMFPLRNLIARSACPGGAA